MTETRVRCPYREDVTENGRECGRLCEDYDELVDHISDDHDPLGPILARAERVELEGGEPA